MFPLFLDAAWQVALAALLLGAGLPALFALGVRSFAVAGGAVDGGGSGPARPALRFAGVLCFVLVVCAVLVGLTVIIATGFGQTVSFEHIVPTLVDKE
ncbi:hypothetical protein ACFSBZ_04435 [Amnibacterium flavum]|uniref:Uncharacterized protein n=1 Tax=Amnibacterium flavum TaxID=2173173 RepID=A0A2V1HT91_9MICO|nr:hypothetical protein [Amnibacterium flavum]PVZ94269.1 hypothetical protein DDQ50_11035 [Amnibacterium flavum]